LKKAFITIAMTAAALAPFAAQAQNTSASTAGAQSAPDQQASAATAAKVTPTVGAKVYGPDGTEAGTVEKVDAANAVVYTGTKRATLPLAVFGKNDKGLLISMNKAQLEAAVAAAESKTSAATSTALVADAQVKTSDGVAIGTVQKVEGDNVTLALSEGSPITLTKQFITAAPDGSLALTMNDADFKKAVAAATQSAASAPASADAKATPDAQTAETPAPAGQ